MTWGTRAARSTQLHHRALAFPGVPITNGTRQAPPSDSSLIHDVPYQSPRGTGILRPLPLGRDHRWMNYASESSRQSLPATK